MKIYYRNKKCATIQNIIQCNGIKRLKINSYILYNSKQTYLESWETLWNAVWNVIERICMCFSRHCRHIFLWINPEFLNPFTAHGVFWQNFIIWDNKYFEMSNLINLDICKQLIFINFKMRNNYAKILMIFSIFYFFSEKH